MPPTWAPQPPSNFTGSLQCPDILSNSRKRRLSSDCTRKDDDDDQLRSNANVQNRYPRRRALVACYTCRAKKTKCDNQRPTCGSCLTLGCSCSYADSSADQSSFDSASLAILSRVNYAIGLLENQSNQLQLAGSPMKPLPTKPHIIEDQTTPHEDLLELSAPAAVSAVRVLEWPIFRNKHDSKSLDAAVFDQATFESATSSSDGTYWNDDTEICGEQTRGNDFISSPRIYEGEVPNLIQLFLQNVHVKNPVLDPIDLKQWASAVAEHGFGWGSKSCLLLVACASGSLSSSFTPTSFTASDVSSIEADSKHDARDFSGPELYYRASRKRVGLLDTTLIAAQCFFLSGVYEMYTLRPLQAWSSFNKAAAIIQMHGMRRSTLFETELPPTALEHRLYWSCLKSISEIREHLPLPPSGLVNLNYPLFPMPPASCLEKDNTDHPSNTNLEKSWFYYLAEISGRRIANRILNVFYSVDQEAWLSTDLDNMVNIARELEVQVNQWITQVAEHMICKTLQTQQEELPFMIKSRELHLLMFIYRPFLFIAIHHPNSLQNPNFQRIVDTGIRCFLRHASVSTLKHRHHGTYLAGRSLLSTGFIILAVLKSGHIEMPLGWQNSLQGILAFLQYWGNEAPDLHVGWVIFRDIWQSIL